MHANVWKTTAIATILVVSAGAAQALQPSSDSGIPDGFTEEDWMAASGEVTFLDDETLQITAEGLVPDGIYTVWAVETGTFGMRAEPGGGLPGNTFVADRDGNAERIITVDPDNPYDIMIIAYHADHRTHGDNPGTMGEVTFDHLSADWPRP